jgi:hypothetical protein
MRKYALGMSGLMRSRNPSNRSDLTIVLIYPNKNAPKLWLQAFNANNAK